ncbi:MAG TPA: hypothetical protein VMC84_07745 [Methanocella sp.]|nr:hypothetical protein [Methanocella sp.]
MKTAIILLAVMLILAPAPACAMAHCVSTAVVGDYNLGCPGCPGCPDNPARDPNEPACF